MSTDTTSSSEPSGEQEDQNTDQGASGAGQQAPSLEDQVKALTAQLESAKAESRKWETRSKDNHKAAQQLEAQRQASMTEAERAVAEAEARGRTAATAEFGKRLAKSAFEAAAARRNPEYDGSALDFVDLSRFVGEDGEPDAKAIATAVERLVPAATTSAPSFDGGARTSAPKGADMNRLMREAVGRG